MSTTISRGEKNNSVQLGPVDALAETLLERVRALLKARPDLDRVQFARRIGRPTPSWISEFLSGKRTTNDLRLVITIAHVFGVSVAYLLNEESRDLEPDAAMLLGNYRGLDEKARQSVLQLAVMLRDLRREGGWSELPNGEPSAGARHTTPGPSKPRGRKFR